MNALVRAVREAERQLRQFPPALTALLRADVVARRVVVETGWADTSPFAELGAIGAAVGGAEAEAAAPRRGTPPAPLRGAPRAAGAPPPTGSAGALGRALAGAAGGGGGGEGGALEAVARGVVQAVEGVAAGAARITSVGPPDAPAGSLAALGKAVVFPLRGGRAGQPGASGASVPPASGERTGGIGALGRAVARAAASAEGVSPPGVAEAAGAAALTGVAEAVAGVFDTTLGRIADRLDSAEQRAREGSASGRAAAAGEAVGRRRGGRAPTQRAAAEVAPELPSEDGPARDPLLPPPATAGRTSPAPAETTATDAAPTVDPEWVVAVVSDALLEQARRQGVDLT